MSDDIRPVSSAMRRVSSAVFCFFAIVTPAAAEVKLPSLFSDGLVLQRDRDVPVWGTATPNAGVTVEIDGETKSARASVEGRWRLTLAPHRAGGPHLLRVSEGSGPSLEIRDVQFGEVWIASGQSNMHWTFTHDILDKERELDAAADPLLRQFTVAKARAYVRKGEPNEPASDAAGRWYGASRDGLLAGGEDGASALAYFFGRTLRKELKVPVGIINASVGGSPIEAWMPGGSLFNKMIHPLAPMAIRGVIWYQGEANIAAAGAGYVESTQKQVAAWRDLWKQGNFPYYYVQLAPFIHSTRPNSKSPWYALPAFWESQTAIERIVPNTGMVVVTDLVTDVTNIHPPNKQDVGLRLARLALANDYGRTEIVTSGPTFREAKVTRDAVRIEFDHVHGGLMSRDGKPLSHFQIAGDDRKFVPAQAVIDGMSVIVRSTAIAKPAAVRFAWTDTATPNLMNKEGLPANSFRSDQWPLEP
jgi:sialate O-acetylesterase